MHSPPPIHPAPRSPRWVAAAPKPQKPPASRDACRTGSLAECRAACDAPDDEACRAFGRRICREGSVVECQAACDGDNVAACQALADLYRSGERVPKDPVREVALREKTCRRGDLQECSSVAERYYSVATTIGDPTNPIDRMIARERAPELFRLACEGRLAEHQKRPPDQRPDPANRERWWPFMGAANVGSHMICHKMWTTGAAGECAVIQGTDCDMLLEVEPSSAAMLATACEASQWVACTALARDKALPADAPEVARALRKLCAHFGAMQNHESSYCGRLKDLGLGDEGQK
jgi:hypothetical protein